MKLLLPELTCLLFWASAVIAVLLPANNSLGQSYRLDWYVIGSGGGHSQSANYQLDCTLGQPIVGHAVSTNYQIDAGFWVGLPVGSACQYTVGDVNNNGAFNGIDVSYSVGYFKGGAPPPFICNCNDADWYVAGDVNGNCAFNGIDVSYMVGYFKGGAGPIPCPQCPPGLMAGKPAPAIIPNTLKTRIEKAIDIGGD